MGFLAAHYSQGVWRATFVPIAFAVAMQENQATVRALVNSVASHLQASHSFDLAAHTGSIYLDGGDALLAVFRSAFPDATIVRCMEHVKKNIMQASKEWNKVNRGKQVKAWIHHSAYLPPALFSMFWHGAIADLRDSGEEKCLGLFCARFQLFLLRRR